MQARTGARTAETASLLESFGIELSAGGLVVMTDFAKAESAYVHHSRVPVAVVAMALGVADVRPRAVPQAAPGRIVAKAPVMDDAEKHALATVCGASIADVPWSSSRAPAFAAHLVDVIARYELDAFFTRDPSRSINGIDVRPGGIDRRDAVDPKAMAEWRRAFKALPPARQMMVATIICLYRGEADKLWLTRLPATWHAADAIATLQDVSALRDFGRLVALYPGW